MSQAKPSQPETAPQSAKPQRVQTDLLALGIAVAATIMVAGIASSALTQMWNKLSGIGYGPDQLLINALLLNIALVIFGWRRYDDLHTEVLEHRRSETLARQMAQTDHLTGLLSRHSIAPHTDALIAAARERGEVVAFVLIDVNNFKQINELNGHGVGDALLKELGGRLVRLMPPDALVARLGGDEFACVVPFAPDNAARIDHLAQAIVATLGAEVKIQQFAGEMGLALGLARSDSAEPADCAGLLHRADIALLQAKKGGRNQSKWFEGTMETELRYRCEMEAAIRRAIPRGEFVPYYEQQVELASGRILGFEMLARWQSPDYGLVGPDVFIPVAEEIGVIADLSEGLIAKALEDARSWDPSLTLSVNISPVQLRDPWFAQKLLKLLVSANFPPNRLEIEITETCLHQNIAGVQALITSLRNQGIAISLDDFGTGYSSLSQLRSLPFDRIKIDRSFVAAMRDDPDSRTIVETIAALGKGLNLPITAEGIESEELLDALKALGNFKGQGYLYGKPQPADATCDLLARHQLLAKPASGPASEHASEPASGPAAAGQPEQASAAAPEQDSARKSA